MAKELTAKQWDLVKWGNKSAGEVSKKIVLEAIDYNAQLVCQTTEPGQDKIKFVDVCKVVIDQKDFFRVAHALFNRAVGDITRKAYKAREAGQDAVLCDLAHTTSDFYVIRVRSVMKFKDGSGSRITKIMIHKLNGWDDVKEAGKRAQELKNGSLGYTKESCIFEITFSPFPVVQGNWADSEDIIALMECYEKIKAMFIKPTSYGSFLDRVYEATMGESAGSSHNNSTETTTVGTTVTVDDDFDIF